jgi:hypothetical protein
MISNEMEATYGRGEIVVLILTGIIAIPIMILCGYALIKLNPIGVGSIILGILLPLITIVAWVLIFVIVLKKNRQRRRYLKRKIVPIHDTAKA